ncbi:MAG TPA: methyltransferase [Vicinamibacterales bacterium]|nr:methyltransferase [Vicinamibacterales bacterium]
MSARFAPGSKTRLTRRDLDRFPGRSLFDRVARAVCQAGCLPRKELYEAWEVARRTRRWFRGGRIVDLGAGHGLLAHLMLILDDTSPTAVAVDPSLPPSAARLHDVLAETWPRLSGRVSFVSGGPDDVAIGAGDIVVSCHACGALTDRVLAGASQARARVVVLPCCHDRATCDTGGLDNWLDLSLAIDVVRVTRLHAQGYQVRTQVIPAAITPKNRLILGRPR